MNSVILYTYSHESPAECLRIKSTTASSTGQHKSTKRGLQKVFGMPAPLNLNTQLAPWSQSYLVTTFFACGTKFCPCRSRQETRDPPGR